jgi:uncharacterized membrane-anchored protein YhcB (DUF1043 family)
MGLAFVVGIVAGFFVTSLTNNSIGNQIYVQGSNVATYF